MELLRIQTPPTWQPQGLLLLPVDLFNSQHLDILLQPQCLLLYLLAQYFTPQQVAALPLHPGALLQPQCLLLYLLAKYYVQLQVAALHLHPGALLQPQCLLLYLLAQYFIPQQLAALPLHPRGPSSSSCGGLRPSASAFFCPSGQKRSFYVCFGQNFGMFGDQ